MEAVDEGLVFIGRADPATQIPYRIVIIQRKLPQVSIQFFEAGLNIRWIGLVSILVCAEQLIQQRSGFRIAGVKAMALRAALQ